MLMPCFLISMSKHLADKEMDQKKSEKFILSNRSLTFSIYNKQACLWENFLLRESLHTIVGSSISKWTTKTACTTYLSFFLQA